MAMESITNWKNEFFETINDLYGNAMLIKDEFFDLVQCGGHLFIHLIPLKNNFSPQQLIYLQQHYKDNKKFLIQLWEDRWRVQRIIVLDRIAALLGKNQIFYARASQVKKIGTTIAIDFLDRYHLQGATNAKYFYGLFHKEDLLCVAAFARLRPMRLKGPDYSSAELIRFATKGGYTVTGGLSKLLKHFIREMKPHDIMTYADRDWSVGRGYILLGFEQTATTEPLYLYVDPKTLSRYYPHRLNEENRIAMPDLITVFTTGNLKYHLYCL